MVILTKFITKNPNKNNKLLLYTKEEIKNKQIKNYTDIGRNNSEYIKFNSEYKNNIERWKRSGKSKNYLNNYILSRGCPTGRKGHRCKYCHFSSSTKSIKKCKGRNKRLNNFNKLYNLTI